MKTQLKFRTLGGSMSALFNLDGRHGTRLLEKMEGLTDTVIQNLLLYEQIVIPTQDYLTAAALCRYFGEQNFLELLEEGALRFIRLRGGFGYCRGKGTDGTLVAFEGEKKPFSSPLDKAVDAGISTVWNLRERTKLKHLLVQATDEMEMAVVLGAVRGESYADLQRTPLWRTVYKLPQPDLLALRGVEPLQVRVIGPGTDPTKKAVDLLLVLALKNIEVFLAERFGCGGLSTATDLGEFLADKTARAFGTANRGKLLFHLFEINGVPQVPKSAITDEQFAKQFRKLRTSRDASAFRDWFHGSGATTEVEITQRYVEILHQIPTVQTFPLRVIRFLTASLLGMVPVVGHVASFIDTFLIDALLRNRSPKFFVEDVKRFAGSSLVSSVSSTR